MGVSAEPLLVEPTHYTGEPGYITDTESSEVIELMEHEFPANKFAKVKGDEGDASDHTSDQPQGPGRPNEEL